MNKKKIILIALIITLTLGIIGVAYAYFGLEVEGTGKDIVMDTGDLRLEYMDDTELSLVGATPGDSISKKITVKNVGTRKVAYTLYWGDLINTIENFELHITMECKSYKNYGTDTQEEIGTCDRIYRAVPMSDTITSGTIKSNISIDVGVTHEYNLTITFDDKSYEQNYNKNKKFTGKIGIEEYKAPEPIYCTYDGELKFGTEYTNGIYTYRYHQKGVEARYSDISWQGQMSIDGWGVQFNDRSNTDDVTEAPCTYINNIPVTSMAYMFNKAKANSIDLGSFDTSNITNMEGMFKSSSTKTIDVSGVDTSNVINMTYMFSNSSATEIKGLESFDTSKTTNMSNMFEGSNVTNLDLTALATSNVTNMSSMFYDNKSKSIDFSKFDTSNVTNMAKMFAGSTVDVLDLSAFDTSKVTNMYMMFYSSNNKIIDFSSFNTSSLTTMSEMFRDSNVSSIDLSSFDTSKINSLYMMFADCTATSINLTGFDTSNVTNMSYMFYNSDATDVKGLEKFNTSNVTNMSNMFYSSKVTLLNLNSFDTTNVTNMENMFYASAATEIKGLENFNTSKVTNMKSIFRGSQAVSIDLSKFNTSSITDMSYMFYNSKMTEIKGLENFDTSNVTDMNNMFAWGGALSLDLSSFDTSKVTNMRDMFSGCKDVKKISVSDKFVTSNVTSSSDMFYNCINLVGGAGTVYDKSKVDKTYARVDGGTDLPGYFTLKS